MVVMVASSAAILHLSVVAFGTAPTLGADARSGMIFVVFAASVRETAPYIQCCALGLGVDS